MLAARLATAPAGSYVTQKLLPQASRICCAAAPNLAESTSMVLATLPPTPNRPAGGELLIPTIVLLYGTDIKIAGSLSLAV